LSIADLGGQAREFAGHITNLLNRTVTNGIRIKAVLNPGGSKGWVGYEISKTRPQAVVPIPITTGRADARGYLVVLHRLALDAEGTYITTTSSRLELHLTADLEQPIVRYDYNRDPVLAKNDLPYPPAHVHVHGEHGPVDRLAEAAAVERKLSDFHWPVGGKRFRPSLEDLVEFLIVEDLADKHDGWKEAIDEHRGRWYEIQLKAAVRRSPDLARAALQEIERE
jgi:hypothetical protein